MTEEATSEIEKFRKGELGVFFFDRKWGKFFLFMRFGRFLNLFLVY